MKQPLNALCALLVGLTIAACSEKPSGLVTDSDALNVESGATIDSDSGDLTPHQQNAKNFLHELIEIDTTHPNGDNTAAAQAMAEKLLAAGFIAEDVQVLEPAERKGNLVARYRGRDPDKKPLLLLAHIDVVAADPADWTLPPFEFTEQDGYFYGRGVVDDKDEAAIHVANFIRLREEGYVPDRDIVIALTADEEGGTHNGVTWLLENHRNLIDAEYALNEGGGGGMQNGVHILNAVQASEKVFQSFTLETTNPGGHSSLPVKDNAIYHLADALIRVRNHDFPVSLNEVTSMYFGRSADMGGEYEEAMRGILHNPPDPAAVAQLSKIPMFNSRLRTTCVATELDGGHAENALPQRARATVNCRVLPGESIDAVEETLRTVIGNSGVAITRNAVATPSPPSPLTPDVLGSIEAITEEMWPGVPVIPTMSTGATDGLFLRNAGIPVYGVSGLFSDMDEPTRAHGQNERILASSFFDGQEFLYRLTKILTTEDIQ
jgi:acetylornithine deacetylase/succinyl-diaminopimelate desuccinylase-like protein